MGPFLTRKLVERLLGGLGEAGVFKGSCLEVDLDFLEVALVTSMTVPFKWI